MKKIQLSPLLGNLEFCVDTLFQCLYHQTHSTSFSIPNLCRLSVVPYTLIYEYISKTPFVDVRLFEKYFFIAKLLILKDAKNESSTDELMEDIHNECRSSTQQSNEPIKRFTLTKWWASASVVLNTWLTSFDIYINMPSILIILLVGCPSIRWFFMTAITTSLYRIWDLVKYSLHYSFCGLFWFSWLNILIRKKKFYLSF